ncbi:MAG: hypothetical protein HYS75_01510 [Nitrosopumilales archaeon]|nr:hypothetical protein [Nitrosopumilales archaeon]
MKKIQMVSKLHALNVVMVLKIMMMNSEILQEKQIELFQKLNSVYNKKVKEQAQNSRSTSLNQMDRIINACSTNFTKIVIESFTKLDK